MPEVIFQRYAEYRAQVTKEELAQMKNGEIPAEELLGEKIESVEAEWKNGTIDYNVIRR